MKRAMFALVLLSLMFTFVFVGQANISRESRGVFDSVVAKRFVLKDQAGITRAQMTIDRNDAVRLTLHNRIEKNVFILSALPDGRVQMNFRDNLDRIRIAISLDQEGNPQIRLFDNDMKQMVIKPQLPSE